MAATLAAGLFFYSSCTPAEKTDTKDYTQYVNTFIGGADNGHTFPGACYPFGMIQTSPVTGAVGWRYCSEYVYEDSLVWGIYTDTFEWNRLYGFRRYSGDAGHGYTCPCVGCLS